MAHFSFLELPIWPIFRWKLQALVSWKAESSSNFFSFMLDMRNTGLGLGDPRQLPRGADDPTFAGVGCVQPGERRTTLAKRMLKMFKSLLLGKVQLFPVDFPLPCSIPSCSTLRLPEMSLFQQEWIGGSRSWNVTSGRPRPRDQWFGVGDDG
jgi:hypothetical protein